MSAYHHPNLPRMTPAERAAYARGEIHSAIVDDGTLHHDADASVGGGGGGAAAGGFNGGASTSSFHNSLSQIPTHFDDNASFVSGGNNTASVGGAGHVLNASSSRAGNFDLHVTPNDDEGMHSPAYLFSVLEEALPKFADAAGNHHHGSGTGGGANAAHQRATFSSLNEQQMKREQMEHAWEKVRRWLWAHPDVADRRAAAYVRGQADATSLHLVCKLHNPPDDVVAALVEAAPDAVSWTDTHGWLPLHHACANGASPEVIKILIDAHPEGKIAQDDQSRTPLHFYVTRSSDNVANMALNAQLLCEGGVAPTVPDKGGMLPMHYACAYGTHPSVLEVLATVHPASVTAKESHGRTPMHLAMVNAHRDASPNTIRFLLSRPESRDTINCRDKDGFLPLHLLALSLKGYRMDEPEKRYNVGESLSLYLEAEPFPTADFLTAIQDLPDWLHDTAVVSKHVRNVLNDKIAKRLPTSILMMDGYMLLVWIVCFAVTSHNMINVRFSPDKFKNDTGAALVICFVASVYFFFRELVQAVSLISLGCFSNWWKDPTNWLDCSVIVLVTYYAVLMATGASVISDAAFRSGVAFTQGLLWVSIIMFLKNTLVDFAVFVGGVFYVVQRLLAFLLAVGIILLAFAQMFYFIYTETPMCEPPTGDAGLNADGEVCEFPHCTFGYSLLQVYSMMMGEINTVNRYSTNLTAQIIFVVYAFLVVILLSNVLIAVVTDSYEIIQNDRAAIVFWNNRLNFVAEMDAITYAIQRRFFCRKGKHGGKRGSGGGSSSAAFGGEAQEGPDDSRHDPNTTGTSTALNASRNKPEEAADDSSVEGSSDYFREAWHQVLLLFDDNLYDEVDWIEAVVYNVFRVVCVFFVIPLWILVGALTAGWLWPPQVREYLFVQKETVVSRAELERHKLQQLMAIQEGLKKLKHDIKHEMEGDRDEMLRMRTEVETIQSEVLGDLQQVKELMSTLLGE
jgi:Ion transport protein/Ankyrin repeats (many copies)